MTREKLTVLIPCRDEQHNIRACVDSVRGIADEILVADSGSIDATTQIVREMGCCRLIEREFVDYADFKNWAIPQASHAWVLIVDSDERVTDELAEEIRARLVDPPANLDGYWIGRRNKFMGREIKYSGWQSDKVFRLIRRDKCRYRECRVHEEINVQPHRAGRLKHRLVHHSYASYDEYFGKYLRYTKWGAQDKWDAGKRASFASLLFRPFLRFLLLYFVRRGFLDGLRGLQICMCQAFFVTFVKQARLWELEHSPTLARSGAGDRDRQSSQRQSPVPAAANSVAKSPRAA